MTKTKTKINKLKKNNCSKFVVYKKCNFLKCKKIKGLENENGYINKYIDFNTFEDNKTKIPKGYKKVNYDITDIKESWCDNSKQLLSKDNEMYKKIKKKNMKTYFTHDNGGRPFLIYIGKTIVNIYKFDSDNFSVNYDMTDEQFEYGFTKLVAKYKPLKIFIGKSEKCPQTDYSGAYGKYYDGNSILLKIKKNRYVYIGSTIDEFDTNDTIIEYFSPVGNNNVPYPVAFGKKNVYFMLDEKFIPLDKFPVLTKKERMDAYSVYYHEANGMGIKYSKFAKKMKSTKNIHKRI
jgi:hypothetical protein